MTCACLLLSRHVVWLTGLPSSVLVIATPLPQAGGGGVGEHEGRDLLQHVELSWGSPDEPPHASVIGTPSHSCVILYFVGLQAVPQLSICSALQIVHLFLHVRILYDRSDAQLGLSDLCSSFT